MKEKILLSIIEKNYADGKKDKCIKHMNQYFKKHYDISKLLLSGIKYEFYLENVKYLADFINDSYTEKEIAVFAEFGLTNFIQKLLDNNWGGLNKAILFGYVPALINYDNLKDITYSNLYNLYGKEASDDILRRFNENIDLVHSLRLYEDKKDYNKTIKNEKIIFVEETDKEQIFRFVDSKEINKAEFIINKKM